MKGVFYAVFSLKCNFISFLEGNMILFLKILMTSAKANPTCSELNERLKAVGLALADASK